MTMFALGEAAARVLGGMARAPGGATRRRSGTPHRTGQPVRRDSMEAGSFEEHFFRLPARGETDRMLRAARAALDAGRRLRRAVRTEGRVLTAAERACAGLTAGAVRVYQEICTLARLNGGRVFPSYDHLAEASALGRATVARALHLLEAAGLLVRQRRFCRVEGEGPRYRQTSNAYRPTLSGRLMGLLPRSLRSAPIPDDMAQAQADRAQAVAAMEATLSCRELAAVTTGGALGRMLARLGAAIDLRESQKGSEPQTQS